MDTLFPFCLDVKLPNESKLVPDLAESHRSHLCNYLLIFLFMSDFILNKLGILKLI